MRYSNARPSPSGRGELAGKVVIRMTQEPQEEKNVPVPESAPAEAASPSAPAAPVDVAAGLSAAWLSLPEETKARFLKQMAEKAPKMLDNWMVRAGVPAGTKRAEVAKRAAGHGERLDALVADLPREKEWAPTFVDWFKHVKTYMNDACTDAQQKLAIAGCPAEQVEGKMIEAVRYRYKDDPFIHLFIATVHYHNLKYAR